MADLINGQVVGTAEVPYDCGLIPGKWMATCYRYTTYRVRRYKNSLLITYTYTSRAGDTPGEMVMNEQQIKENATSGNFYADFRQSPLWDLLAKQAYLSGQGIGSGETQLSSAYTEDNETVLTPALLVKQTITGNGGGSGGGNDDDDNDGGTGDGLTLDQLLPWIAGGVIGISLLVLVIVVATKRR